ncbi:3-phosphoinositide-dependent protein kinase 1 [Aphelenchoides fujianensis]|nr:3-phosphoinositide-dependent protein kinase 1 [Aphelenchoides fujianensis]
MNTGVSSTTTSSSGTEEAARSVGEPDRPPDRRDSASPTPSAGHYCNSDPTSSTEELFCAQRNAAKGDTDFWDMSQPTPGENEKLERDPADDYFVDSALLLADWDEYTTLYVPPNPRPPDTLYDDFIAHSMDDYDEEAERRLEEAAREKPLPFGPISQQEFVRLAFCRVKRHNSRSPLSAEDADMYYFTRHLGHGSFASVYQAKRVGTDEPVAIKVMSKRQVLRERKAQYVSREKDIMATMAYGHRRGGHPFIAKLLSSFQEEDRLYFVMTFAANNELLFWLRRLGSFDNQVTKFYSSELVSALEYMHSCGIVHRDLKPENILLQADWHILITDFGSAKVLGFEGDEPVPEKRDIHKKMSTVKYKFPEGFDAAGKDLVRRLLVTEPTERLGSQGAEEIKNHEFFEGVDWENIFTRTPPVLKPYIPAGGGEPEFYSEFHSEITSPCPEDTGLSNKALVRLMGMTKRDKFVRMTSDDTEESPPSPPPLSESPVDDERKGSAEMVRQSRLEAQRQENSYHRFVEEGLITKSGLLEKKKGLFARQRMFLLTDHGRLFYVDPVRQELKGEVPITASTKTEAKNFRTFFVHTPNRTYYLYDPSRRATEWCEAINEVIRERRPSSTHTTTSPDTPKPNSARRRGKSWGRFRKDGHRSADPPSHQSHQQ